jgi:glycosyltransferase 2 family protein
MPASRPPRSGLRTGLLALARWACAGILLYAAGRQLFAELKKLENTELTVDLPLLLLGAGLYAAAMAGFAEYWRQTALGMGGRPGGLEAQRAYFASQLGKYIPGKAWVIVIRCALIDSQTTSAGVIIASTFYETLAMMAAGSLLALAALLAAGSARPEMLLLSGGLAAGLLLAVLPPVFRRLATWTARSFQKPGASPAAAVTWSLWSQGLGYCAPGWILAGLSLMAIAGSLGIPLFSFAGFLLCCGTIALAIAGGFAVLIVPAGLGVREWVMMQTLGPSIGTSDAVLVAILARITHVSVELLAAACLYGFGKRKRGDD